ncbi:hypothetical protein LOZ64_000747 [Ophidiomyces ophidiicola]|nr:hypothetical protein LOZ64_000747 [Ophidiomyces ophidiicola]KAI2137043.1 hypothetical protein LOZ29_003282 [Ophidiomyces ophidiicola]KAI2449286.1 pH-response regulator protein palA/rim20 [Ophidiomyces ophidiicola]
MARPRALSGADGAKEPHSLSLTDDHDDDEVLRLSRPSFSYQYPLPEEFANIPVEASLSYPAGNLDKQFMLSPNLALPPSFGSAYVGETFACSLSANNELRDEGGGGGASRVVTAIRLVAEMQTPSQIVPLELHDAHDELQQAADARLGAGIARVDSIQRIVRFDLKEEGNHVLAVSISYTETLTTAAAAAAMTTTTGVGVLGSGGSGSGVQASGGRARTFRKLYQFVAQPCLNVRTKATELAAREVDNRSLGPYGKSKLQRFVLEAQLENVGDEIITLGVCTCLGH